MNDTLYFSLVLFFQLTKPINSSFLQRNSFGVRSGLCVRTQAKHSQTLLSGCLARSKQSQEHCDWDFHRLNSLPKETKKGFSRHIENSFSFLTTNASWENEFRPIFCFRRSHLLPLLSIVLLCEFIPFLQRTDWREVFFLHLLSHVFFVCVVILRLGFRNKLPFPWECVKIPRRDCLKQYLHYSRGIIQ